MSGHRWTREEVLGMSLLGMVLVGTGALMLIFVTANTDGLRMLEVLGIVIGGLLGVWSLIKLFEIQAAEAAEVSERLRQWAEAFDAREDEQ